MNARQSMTLCIALLCVACTTELVVTKVTTDQKDYVTGFTYSLPFTQFEITVVRTLVDSGCTDKLKDGQKFLDQVQYKYSIAAPVIANLADATQTYQIDYPKLSSAWKTSDLKLANFSTGMLQQINATAEDRTAQILANTIKGLANIGLAIASDGIVAPLTEKAKSAPRRHCSKKAVDAFAAQAHLDKVVDVRTAQLNQDAADLKLITAASSAVGANVSFKIQNEVLEQARKVRRDTDALTAATDAAADNFKLFSDTLVFRFPTSGANVTTSHIQEIAIPGSRGAYDLWVICTDVEAKTDNPCPDIPADFDLAFIRLQPVSGANVLPVVSTEMEPAGIRYRVPAQARLLVCGKADEAWLKDHPNLPGCADELEEAWLPASKSLIWEGPVAQLGRMQYLPFKNGPFQNNLLAATFNQDGSMSSAEFEEKSSTLESATGAFSQSTAALGQAIASIRSAPTSKATAQTAAIDAQNALFAAQASQEITKRVALATANTSLLNALAAQAGAQQALDKIRSDSSVTRSQ